MWWPRLCCYPNSSALNNGTLCAETRGILYMFWGISRRMPGGAARRWLIFATLVFSVKLQQLKTESVEWTDSAAPYEDTSSAVAGHEEQSRLLKQVRSGFSCSVLARDSPNRFGLQHVFRLFPGLCASLSGILDS